MTATPRNSIYDHARSKSAQADQRAWQKRPSGDAAEERASERDRNALLACVVTTAPRRSGG
jgi:hypothetical protein